MSPVPATSVRVALHREDDLVRDQEGNGRLLRKPFAGSQHVETARFEVVPIELPGHPGVTDLDPEPDVERARSAFVREVNMRYPSIPGELPSLRFVDDDYG